MKILLIILLVIIIFLLFKLFKSFKINILITIVCSLVILQIILTPTICISYTISGAKLFFNSVFPSIFPFLIVINIIINYDGIEIYSKFLGNILCIPLKLPKECSLALIVSALCGYPLGARYTCDLYEKRIIDLNTCERLLNIASNASPLFIIGAVGSSMMSDPKIGYILLLSNILSCIFMAIFIPSNILSYKTKTNNDKHYITKTTNENIGISLKNSIEDAIKTTLNIGGFIVAFSVITGIIKDNVIFHIILNKIDLIIGSSGSFIESLMLGMLEMTNGCYLISVNNSNIFVKLSVLSFLIGFSGLSIISQVYSYTYKLSLSIKKYIARKFIQGLASSVFTMLLYYGYLQTSSVFAFNNINRYKSNNTHFLLLLILCIPLLLKQIKKLFHIP